MSNLLKCCCGQTPQYWVLQPCYQETVNELVYMSSTDWASCSFVIGNIYSWDTGDPLDDPYCGFWVPTGFKTWDRLDNNCANYTLNEEGCCGGDCIPDYNCCGFQECWLWYYNNNRAVAQLDSWIGGSGSTTGWSAAVTNVAASTGSWASPGVWEFDVTVDVEFSWSNIGSLECDNQTSGTSNGSFTFTIRHTGPSAPPPVSTCLETEIVSFSETDPDCGIRVCDGITGNGTSSSDCSRFRPTFNSGSFTEPALPDFGNDCLQQSAYVIEIPITYTLEPGDFNICLDCDSNGRWSGAAFPNLSISATLTLSGTWS